MTRADGYTEREAAKAKAMANDARQAREHLDTAITLGVDKGYDAREFIEALQEMEVVPHVAQNTSGRRSAVPFGCLQPPNTVFKVPCSQVPCTS